MIRVLKMIARVLCICVIITLSIFVYARFIEPKMLNVRYENIYSDIFKNSKKEIKILQFSDTHISKYFGMDDLKKVVEKINAENPDIVVFTGDLIDNYNTYHRKENIDEIWNILGTINASIGKYAVYGNHDYGGGAKNIYKKIMENSGFELLINKSVKLNEYNLNIVGLDDSIFGDVKGDDVEILVDKDYYNIVLSHEPDVIDYYLEFCIDLMMSGHSHGGQVNLPFVRKYILPFLGQKYVRGFYSFDNFRESKLYVNVGLGTTKLPLRFMAVPEITVFIIKSGIEK